MQLTVGKNSILNFSRQNLNRNVQSPSVSSDDSSQCTAKASLEKGSPWPPDAIPYKEWHVTGLSDLLSDLPIGPALRGLLPIRHVPTQLLKNDIIL